MLHLMIKLNLITMTLVALVLASSNTPQDADSGLVPFDDVRKLAAEIKPGDIRSLRFWGGSFGRGSDEALEVEDPKLIKKFLDALRVAQTRQQMVRNRGDSFEIHFKERNGTLRDPEQLDFRAGFPEDGFGEKFDSLMGDLAKYEIKRIRNRLANTTVDPIEKVTIYNNVDDDVYTVRSPEELKSWKQTLLSIDSRTLAYRDSNLQCKLEITFKSKQTFSIFLVFRTYPTLSKAQHDLPPLLWKCYEYKTERAK